MTDKIVITGPGMTRFRLWLANLISGGEIARQMQRTDYFRRLSNDRLLYVGGGVKRKYGRTAKVQDHI